ncbi:hypothetical protein ON010_g11267 [Phytophthora cinnamomi]|nr:hypothetical protein ON010_g11267 [Phytophthora cinnamomi]
MLPVGSELHIVTNSTTTLEASCRDVAGSVTEQHSALDAMGPRSKKKTASTHDRACGVCLPLGFTRDTSPPAYKRVVLALGDTVEQNAPAFLKARSPSGSQQAHYLRRSSRCMIPAMSCGNSSAMPTAVEKKEISEENENEEKGEDLDESGSNTVDRARRECLRMSEIWAGEA